MSMLYSFVERWYHNWWNLYRFTQHFRLIWHYAASCMSGSI